MLSPVHSDALFWDYHKYLLNDKKISVMCVFHKPLSKYGLIIFFRQNMSPYTFQVIYGVLFKEFSQHKPDNHFQINNVHLCDESLTKLNLVDMSCPWLKCRSSCQSPNLMPISW